MNFDLTDEQQMLQAAARDFLAARLNSEKIRELAESEDAFSEDLWTEIAGLGWPGLMVGADYGGQELGTIELAVLMELALEIEGPYSQFADGSEYALDGDWQYQFLRTRATSIEGGTTDILKNIVAERVLGLPKLR